jgi:hypothetical protein
MPRSAEDLGYPGWVNAFAALIVWVLGALVIYGFGAFIALDFHVANWNEGGRFVFLLLEVLWALMVFHAATDDDGDEE